MKRLSISKEAHKLLPGVYFFQLGALKGSKERSGWAAQMGLDKLPLKGMWALRRGHALQTTHFRRPWVDSACSGRTWGQSGHIRWPEKEMNHPLVPWHLARAFQTSRRDLHLRIVFCVPDTVAAPLQLSSGKVGATIPTVRLEKLRLSKVA